MKYLLAYRWERVDTRNRTVRLIRFNYSLGPYTWAMQAMIFV